MPIGRLRGLRSITPLRQFVFARNWLEAERCWPLAWRTFDGFAAAVLEAKPPDQVRADLPPRSIDIYCDGLIDEYAESGQARITISRSQTRRAFSIRSKTLISGLEAELHLAGRVCPVCDRCQEQGNGPDSTLPTNANCTSADLYDAQGSFWAASDVLADRSSQVANPDRSAGS